MEDNQDTGLSPVARLQAIVEEERLKREQAENDLKAVMEEFSSCGDFDELRDKFKEKLKDLMPQALGNIQRLMSNAESESVQANLNKWIIEWVMSDKLDGSSGDLQNLMKKLQVTK